MYNAISIGKLASPTSLFDTGYIARKGIQSKRKLHVCPMSDQDTSCLYGIGLTLAILKSFSTPLDFPPSMHLLLICVDLV